MTVTSWFHVWCEEGSHWCAPVEEHLQALARSKFTGRFKVGIVGPPDTRAEALALISAQRSPDVVKETDTGWEQHTLAAVRTDARRNPKGITLYCHTKGASHNTRSQDAWRRSMHCALLARFGETVQTLSKYEAVGCHWLDGPGGGGFAGNFWLARNSLLASLPPLSTENRWQAESWIGSGTRKPRVLDLNPGHPGEVSWVHAIGWPR